jgi:hypothetical protein
MNFADWISSTLATTFLIAVLGFILRHWIAERIKGSIKHEYDKDLATHKAELKRNYDVQIEQLRAQLQIANVRFSHIYVKQAEAIAATYKQLLPLVDAVEDYTKLIQTSEGSDVSKRINALNAASSNFFAFYRNVKIYIPEPTAKRLMDFVNTVIYIARKHSMLETATLLQKHAAVEGGESTKTLEKFGEEIEKMKDGVAPLLAELKNDFQALLGVHTGEQE